MKVLAINAGSTSLKLGLFEVGGERCEAMHETQVDGPDFAAAEDRIGDWPTPDAVAHRMVHGGPKLRRHALIDPEVLAQLEAAQALAPLHVPPALKALAAARAAVAGHPARRLPGRRLPCRSAAGRPHPAGRRGGAGGRSGAVRLPWSLLRLDRPAARDPGP